MKQKLRVELLSKNVKKIASTGVSRISVGQITHSAPATDFKLQI